MSTSVKSSFVLHKICKKPFRNCAGLAVSDSQKPFVCEDLERFVRSAPEGLACYHMMQAGQPVGFFALDSRTSPLTEPGAVMLRSFFIDRRHQGRGLAQECLRRMPQWVRQQFPGCPAIYLTVNFKNERAAELYLRAGFRCLAEAYWGGAAGPQHVMRLSLGESAQREQLHRVLKMQAPL